MVRILHLIEGVSLGGGTRAVLTAAKYSAYLGDFHHEVISLLPADTRALKLAKQAGVMVYNAPDRETILKTMAQSDIVQIDWWNSPILNELLYSELPPIRLLTWFHVGGDSPLQIITRELIEMSDFVLTVCPYSYSLPVFRTFPKEEIKQKVGMVYAPADFERLTHTRSEPHDTFNVGYIGSLDFVKMNPMYVSMSAVVNIPKLRFIVCGQSYFGDDECLLKQVEFLNKSDIFDFRGYVENIQSVISLFDVYGYPLCEHTYAAAELNLQEVMFAGIPPVVFPYGGCQDLVINGETGLIVQSETEYIQAIEHLYHNAQERKRLGQNAHLYAKQVFGGENAAQGLNHTYERMMHCPKLTRAQGAKIKRDEDEKVGLLRPGLSGAELFMKFSGHYEEAYQKSFCGENIAEVLDAERKIAASAMIPIMRSQGYGSVTHYQRHFPNDGYLQLWCGLQLQYQLQFQEALIAFETAIRMGFDHWRVYWYLAQAAEKLGKVGMAEQAVINVIHSAPDFHPALALHQSVIEKTILANYQLGTENQNELGQKDSISFSVKQIIDLFEERIYTYRPASTLIHRREKPPQVNLETSYDVEFQDLRRRLGVDKKRDKNLYRLFCLARYVCQQGIPGNFVQFSETSNIFTIVLAYTLKEYSTVPRLLYLIPSSHDVDSDIASDNWLENLSEDLGISDIMISTKSSFQHIIDHDQTLLGMIALLCLPTQDWTSIDDLLEKLGNQLIGGSVLAFVADTDQSVTHHQFTQKLWGSCPPMPANDGNAIYFTKTTRFPRNSEISPELIAAFQSDDFELRHILSQMSINERFQIYYTLTSLLAAGGMPLRFIEIGSYAGASLMLTYYALKRKFEILQGFAIDPQVHPQFFDNIRVAQDEIIHLPMKSGQAMPVLHTYLRDSSVSFILVDGDHSYAALREDILNYYPLLKPGGIMLLHDFLPALNDYNKDAIMIQHAGREPGIRQACQELLEQTYNCEILNVPLLYPSDPTQSQAHLPIIPNVYSTIRVYRKRLAENSVAYSEP